MPPFYCVKDTIKREHRSAHIRFPISGAFYCLNQKLATWLDRPLSIAVRVLVETDKGMEIKLIDIDRDLLLIPNVAISTCIFIGWVVKPKTIIDEVALGGHKFSRQKLYVVMVKFITPVLLTVLLQALGLIKA